MRIGSISENLSVEKRVSITPEIAGKFIKDGFIVKLEKNYAKHLGFLDKDYESLGVEILEDKEKIINDSDIIVQLNLLSENLFEKFDENKNLVGVLNPYLNQEKLNILIKKKDPSEYIQKLRFHDSIERFEEYLND